MKKISILIPLLFFACTVVAQHSHGSGGYADSVNRGLIAKDTMKGSPHRVAMADVGDAHVHVEYGSPGVKGRMIWGGLVAYDQVWAAGAHNATRISFSSAVKFAGKEVPAGNYAFFLIPGKETFTVVLNKKYKQHLADEYDEKDDVLRVNMKPKKLSAPVQRLTYEVKPTGKNAGELRFSWESILITIPIRS